MGALFVITLPYIKAKGIIGGDFNKGDNVLVSVDNGELIFKVSEFRSILY